MMGGVGSHCFPFSPSLSLVLITCETVQKEVTRSVCVGGQQPRKHNKHLYKREKDQNPHQRLVLREQNPLPKAFQCFCSEPWHSLNPGPFAGGCGAAGAPPHWPPCSAPLNLRCWMIMNGNNAKVHLYFFFFFPPPKKMCLEVYWKFRRNFLEQSCRKFQSQIRKEVKSPTPSLLSPLSGNKFKTFHFFNFLFVNQELKCNC